MYGILVADDEAYVRDLLVKYIRNSSLDVEVVAVADNGREGLAMALSLKPDIVITDISMPFLNGLELIKEIGAAGLRCKSAVISGYDEFDYARQAISLGITDYLLKPFLPKELIRVIEKMTEELDSQKTLRRNITLLRQQAGNRVGLARERAIKDLLMGWRREEKTEGSYGQLGLELEGNRFLSGLIQLSGRNFDFSVQDGVEEFLMLVRDGYLPREIRIYAVSFDGRQLAVIWCGTADTTEEFMAQIRLGLDRICASLERYYHIRFQCALGNVYESEKGLELSYGEAVSLWERILQEDGRMKPDGGWVKLDGGWVKPDGGWVKPDGGWAKPDSRMKPEDSGEMRAGNVVRQIKVLMEQHIKDVNLDLEWISGQVHFSSSYVRQIFKQHTGEGFGEYLIRKRMEQAGRLLQNTQLRIQEISEECGYENQRYFASSFKKFYGCTPTEFKKAVMKEHLY